MGQLVYLRHRPQGRNKIQDSWGPTVHRVVEVQGTTHTVEPVEGGPVKRVHRTNLRLWVGPVPAPRRRRVSAPTVSPVHVPSESVPVCAGPEYVVLEEVPCRSLGQGMQRERDEVADDLDRVDTESREHPEPVSVTPVPATRNSSNGDAGVTAPVPAPRRTLRENAGLHSNPHHIPRPVMQFHSVQMCCPSC